MSAVVSIIVLALVIINFVDADVTIPLSFMYYKQSTDETFLINYVCVAYSATTPVYSGTVYGQYGNGVNPSTSLPSATQLLVIETDSILSSCQFEMFNTDAPTDLLASFTYDSQNITSYSISVFAAPISFDSETGFSPILFAFDAIQSSIESSYGFLNLFFTDPIDPCSSGSNSYFPPGPPYTVNQFTIATTGESFSVTSGSISASPTRLPTRSPTGPSFSPTEAPSHSGPNPTPVPTAAVPTAAVPTSPPNSPTLAPVFPNQIGNTMPYGPCPLFNGGTEGYIIGVSISSGLANTTWSSSSGCFGQYLSERITNIPVNVPPGQLGMIVWQGIAATYADGTCTTNIGFIGPPIPSPTAVPTPSALHPTMRPVIVPPTVAPTSPAEGSSSGGLTRGGYAGIAVATFVVGVILTYLFMTFVLKAAAPGPMARSADAPGLQL